VDEVRRGLRQGGISKAATVRGEPTCRELVAFLAEYLAGEPSPEQVAAFDTHLARCRSCDSYVTAYAATMAASKAAFDGPEAFVPVAEELVQAILESRRNHS
jgi:anti-sigma factor RsiW